MSANGQHVIDLRDVNKVYKGRVHALRGIDMRVHRGEIFGLLGPNGAGKSTLVKILMTIIRPTTCHGTMLGQSVGSRQALARVGYLPEHLKFPDYLTADQALDVYAALAKVPSAERRRRAERLLDVVQMAEWRGRTIKTYSKGMKQRLGLAQALMNEPELVLLDEPTDGVDPVGRRDIREILKRMRDEGRTVFVNSHLLGELEMVCDRVAILSQGQVVVQGTIDELTRHSRRYEIMLASPLPDDPPLAELLTRVKAEIGLASHNAKITILDDQPAAVQPVIDALRAAGAVIEAIRPVRQSLEDFFMQAVTAAGGGQAPPPGAKLPA